ncbi:MAG: hypothetical protein QF858_02790 [Candidatus Pacebacteria bacterium]|jgi:hypothetical protein|nr:hypothetical protein [bacterium]MDP6527781.1 hypothetical protein [Candidatus Paceibacterota bacterium]MDP6659618.1 hypothetical protein [Candidatus Paceibacterota bacterium]|tara:strand:- start:44824 stop:45255 length:432 start_codon:yes stop_codon:yes gene_type:complete
MKKLLEDQKTLISVAVLVLVAVFVYVSIDRIPIESLTKGNGEGIVAKHFYDGKVHKVVGTVDLPTPCHYLETKIAVAESFPEQVTILLTPMSNSEMCAQVITEQTFIASFAADGRASISTKLNGENVPLELVEVESDRDLETF